MLWFLLTLIRISEGLVLVRLGCLRTSSWVVADRMTKVSFRRLPAWLCLYWEVYLR